VTTAVAAPLGFRSTALAGIGRVPAQPANVNSIVTPVTRRSPETVNVIRRSCDVVPAHSPLKSIGVGRGGEHAHQIRIAAPAANCHSYLVNGRENARIVPSAALYRLR
jgi:hypothetical protein